MEITKEFCWFRTAWWRALLGFVEHISYQRLEEVKLDGRYLEGLKVRWKLLAWSNVNIRFLRTLDIVNDFDTGLFRWATPYELIVNAYSAHNLCLGLYRVFSVLVLYWFNFEILKLPYCVKMQNSWKFLLFPFRITGQSETDENCLSFVNTFLDELF